MAFDLDNEELRATRKLHGQDDGLYEEYFKKELLQRPISFLTEENLDKLETHCLKAIRYEKGVEHKVILELLKRHKEYLSEQKQDKKRIQELEKENKKKDKIIDNAIVEIENIRQYFSEDLQPEFIGVLEILKDKKVIDW